MLSAEQKWVLGAALLVITLSAWLLGGRADAAIWIIGGLGFSTAPAAALYWLRYTNREFSRFVIILPWLILAGLIAISLLNAAYEPAVLPDGETVFLEKDHISWLPATVDGARTARFAFLYGGVLCLAVALVVVRPTRPAWRMVMIVSGINAAMLAVVGLAFEWAGADAILGRFDVANPEFFSTFHYHNHWGAWALLSLGALMGSLRSLQAHHLPRRWIVALALCCVVLALALFAGGGRATAGAGLILVVAFAARQAALRMDTRHRKLNAAGAVIVMLAVASIGAMAVGGESIQKRAEKTRKQWADIKEGKINDIRLYAAPRDTLKMAADKPVWGWGLGSYLYIFPIYAGDEFYSPHYKRTRTMEYAHNDYLQALAETGPIGLLLLFLTPFLAVRGQSRKPSGFSCWIGASCLLVLLVALIEFPFGNPAVAATFAVFAAAWVAYPSTGRLAREGSDQELNHDFAMPHDGTLRSA